MSSHAPLSEEALRIRPGGPWSGAWKLALGVGVVGLAGAGVGAFVDATRFAYSYLFAFFVCLTVALGSLFFVLVQHLAGAGWSVTVRRLAEVMATGLIALAVLSVPMLLSAQRLLPWMRGEGSSIAAQADAAKAVAARQGPGRPAAAEPAAKHAEAGGHDGAAAPKAVHAASPHGAAPRTLHEAERAEEEHLLGIKRPWLNPTFFYLRAVLYFLVWGFLAWRLFKLSTEQDESKRWELTASAQRLSPVGTLLFALTTTAAGIDWMMSMAPKWYSTIWGVYLFASSVVAMYAVLIVLALGLKAKGLLGDAVNTEHFHDLGKLLFGFTVFWAYIAFSQFFLIWYSNIPEELGFFHRRWTDGGAWQAVSLLLVVGHFVAPFLVLLSRNTKRRPALLATGAGLLLVMHVVEMYWLVLPNLSTTPSFHWLDLSCLLGTGGLYLAWVFYVLTRQRLIPVGDPRLGRALHFENA